MKRWNTCDERGGIAVPTALFLVLLVGFCVYALDVAIALSVRTQMQSYARQAALAALEVLVVENGTIERARERAEHVARTNMQRHSFGQIRGGEINTLSIVDAAGTVVGTPGDSGWIQKGQWYFQAKTGTTDIGVAPQCWTDDPLNVGNKIFKPCFIASNAGPTDPANAVRVRLNLMDDGTNRGWLSTTFAPGIGMMAEMDVVGTSTAALVPRYLISLVDVSSSVTALNYAGSLNTEQPNTSGVKRYVYESGVTSDDTWWSYLAPTRGSDTDPLNFYQDDYQTMTMTSDAMGAVGRSFHIDTNPLRRPEPLNSILTGLHSAMDFFLARGVNADRVGVFGFDSSSGITLLTRGTYEDVSATATPDYQLTMVPPETASTSRYQKVMNGVDVITYPHPAVASRWDRFMFPRSSGNTDMPMAAGLGMAMLRRGVTQENALLSLIIFSDGGSICFPRSARDDCTGASGNPDSTTCVTNLQHTVSNPDDATEMQTDFIEPLTDNRQCVGIGTALDENGTPWSSGPRRLKALRTSIREFVDLFDNSAPSGEYDPLRARDLRVSIFLAGRQFGVHTATYSAAPNGCMTSDDVINAGYNLTNNPGDGDANGYLDEPRQDGSSPDNALPQVITYYANRLSEVVRNTKGVWAAIRPPCPRIVGTTPFKTSLATACNGVTAGNAVDLETAFSCGSPSADPANICYWVSGNRLLCDPDERTISAQYDEYMDRVLGGTNPFLAVE